MFLGGRFSDRDNVRVKIQIRRKTKLHCFRKWFFIRDRPIHFYLNSFTVFWMVQWMNLSFLSNWKQHPLPIPVHNVLQVRQNFRSHNQKPSETWSSSDCNITENSISKILWVYLEKCKTKNGAMRNINIVGILFWRLPPLPPRSCHLPNNYKMRPKTQPQIL